MSTKVEDLIQDIPDAQVTIIQCVSLLAGLSFWLSPLFTIAWLYDLAPQSVPIQFLAVRTICACLALHFANVTLMALAIGPRKFFHFISSRTPDNGQ